MYVIISLIVCYIIKKIKEKEKKKKKRATHVLCNCSHGLHSLPRSLLPVDRNQCCYIPSTLFPPQNGNHAHIFYMLITLMVDLALKTKFLPPTF